MDFLPEADESAMIPTAQYLLLLLISPAVILVTHAVMTRILGRFSPRTSTLLGCLLAVAGGALLVAPAAWFIYLNTLRPATFWCAAIYGALVYSCLAFCYFIFFTMTETARRIHILRQLYFKHSIPLRDMEQQYGLSGMLALRLERMAALKQLKRAGDRYLLDRRLLYLAGQALAFWAGCLGFRRKNEP